MNEHYSPYQSTKELVKRSFKEKEAANYIGMSRSYLRQSRMANHCQKRDSSDGDDEDVDESKPLKNRTPGPRYIRIGSRAIRYLKEDLDEWLESFSCSNGHAA